jgi:dephospho-CoA kinase
MYCAGKNHVAALLQNRGLPVLDLDALGHSVIETKKTEIFARFGDHIRNPDGSVNRRQLGAEIFGRKDELAALEGIVHPEVDRLTEQWIMAQNGKNCVLNAALLHRSRFFRQLDSIIIVRAPWPVRLIRAKRRDKLPWPALFKRFSSQKHFNAQYLAGSADIYRVENSFCRTEKKLKRQIDKILSKAVLSKTGPVSDRET